MGVWDGAWGKRKSSKNLERFVLCFLVFVGLLVVRVQGMLWSERGLGLGLE